MIDRAKDIEKIKKEYRRIAFSSVSPDFKVTDKMKALDNYFKILTHSDEGDEIEGALHVIVDYLQ